MEKNRVIRFLGGKTSYYVLGLICLTVVTIFLVNQIAFIFTPVGRILSTILPSMIFALVLYFLLNPIVDFLAKKKVPRGISILATYIIVILLLVFGGARLVPVISDQAVALTKALPNSYQDFQESIAAFLDKTFLADYLDDALAMIDDLFKKAVDYLRENWRDGAKGLGSIFSTVSTIFITLFTGPIIAFFLLKEPKKFLHALLSIIPPKFRRDTTEFIKIANKQMGSYLKGQFIASMLLGLIYWGVFLLMGLEYATILALAAGVLSIIPYIGSFLAFLPGLFIAFQDSSFMVVKFLIAWFAVQLLHGDLVVPRVMGDKLKIHTVTILVVLLVMGDLLGLVGVIFGIPIYALVKLVVVFCFRKFKGRYNRFFPEEGKYKKTGFSEEDYF